MCSVIGIKDSTPSSLMYAILNDESEDEAILPYKLLRNSLASVLFAPVDFNFISLYLFIYSSNKPQAVKKKQPTNS